MIDGLNARFQEYYKDSVKAVDQNNSIVIQSIEEVDLTILQSISAGNISLSLYPVISHEEVPDYLEGENVGLFGEKLILSSGRDKRLNYVPGTDTTAINLMIKEPLEDQGLRVYWKAPDQFSNPDGYELFVLKPNNDLSITDLNIEKASLINNEFGKLMINIKLDEEGKNNFFMLSKENIEERIAIFIDNEIWMAPYLMQPIPGGTLQISGHFENERLKTTVAKLAHSRLSKACLLQGEWYPIQ